MGAALLVALLSCASQAADELRYEPDAKGGIRTWLVSEPFEFPPGSDFSKDLLEDIGGEAALRPGGLVTTIKGRRIEWRVVFGGKSEVRPEKKIPSGRTAYYLSTTVRPAAGGRYTLTCDYWADVVVWVDGKEVINGRRQWLRAMSSVSAAVELQADKPHHILVKLGSAGSEALVGVAITDRAGAPAPVTCSLPVPGDQKALVSYLAESLDVSIDNYRFFEPDRTARLVVGSSDYRALPPGLDSEFTARAQITTREGKRLKTFSLGEITSRMLSEGGVKFSYRPTKADLSPFYVVRVELFHNGSLATRLDRKFYCIEGIRKLAEEVSERAEKFYKERDEDEIYEDKNLAYLLLKLEELALLYDTERDAYTFGERALEFVLDAQRRVEIMEKRIEVRPTAGLHEYAYISRVDDSAQPYYIYVPLKYDPMAGAPLIVYLHGYAPDLNKINWQLIPEGLLRLCEKYGYLLVAPFGRSNTDFQGIGEQDVIHVVGLMMKEFGFNIDRDRVFLLGYSMGGMGAYTIAGHYPDRWAGVVALAGRADFYLWKNADPDKLQPFKRWLIGLEFACNVAENFRHVPVLAIQGEYDSLVKVAQSRNFTGKLKEMGYDALFLTVMGEDHWISRPVFSTEKVFEWLEKHRRPKAVKKITFATYSLKYNKAYWATIESFARWGKRAKIDVEITGDNEITVEQTNVAVLRLDPPPGLVDRTRPIVVKAAGKQFAFDAPIEEPLRVELKPLQRGRLRKTPKLCGPIKDAFNTRFIFVYGTQGNPVENKLIYDQAERSVTEWREFVKAVQLLKKEKDLLMVRDRDLTDEQKQKCNLVLLGTPRTNSVLGEIADKLPIKIKDDNTFVVGDREYSGADLGLNMIYPSPFAPDRYVVVKSGVYYGGGLSENHKFDMLPDYIIYGKALDREIAGYYDGMPNRSRCAGFFDNNWHLSDDLMWIQDKAPDNEDDLPWWR